MQQRGLAGAGRPDHRQLLARRDLQRERLQRRRRSLRGGRMARRERVELDAHAGEAVHRFT